MRVLLWIVGIGVVAALGGLAALRAKGPPDPEGLRFRGRAGATGPERGPT